MTMKLATTGPVCTGTHSDREGVYITTKHVLKPREIYQVPRQYSGVNVGNVLKRYNDLNPQSSDNETLRDLMLICLIRYLDGPQSTFVQCVKSYRDLRHISVPIRFQLVRIFHYIDVIMTTMASQITSLTAVYSTVYSDADQRKHQISASLAFVWGFHRDRWIPRTKGQLRGKCFRLMTSSCSFERSNRRLMPLLCCH